MALKASVTKISTSKQTLLLHYEFELVLNSFYSTRRSKQDLEWEVRLFCSSIFDGLKMKTTAQVCYFLSSQKISLTLFIDAGQAKYKRWNTHWRTKKCRMETSGMHPGKYWVRKLKLIKNWSWISYFDRLIMSIIFIKYATRCGSIKHISKTVEVKYESDSVLQGQTIEQWRVQTFEGQGQKELKEGHFSVCFCNQREQFVVSFSTRRSL